MYTKIIDDKYQPNMKKRSKITQSYKLFKKSLNKNYEEVKKPLHL